MTRNIVVRHATVEAHDGIDRERSGEELEPGPLAPVSEDHDPDRRMARPDARNGTDQILRPVLRLQVLGEADDYGGVAYRQRPHAGHGLESMEVHPPRRDQNSLGAEA